MSEVKKENYIAIQAFMVKDLELSGNELVAYALIYGFSQDGESCFKGSLSYVSEWLNCSKATASSILNKLADDGFLEKKEKVINGVKLCDYIAIKPSEESLKEIKAKKEERKKKEKSERYAKKLNTHSKNDNRYAKNLNGYAKNLNDGMQKTLTHNSIDILDDTRDENIVDNTSKGRDINTVNGEADTSFPKKRLPAHNKKKTKEELKKLEMDMFKRFGIIGSQYDTSETAYENIIRAFRRYLNRFTERTDKVHPILKDETLENIFVTLATISDTEYNHFDNVADYEPDENGLSYLDKMVDKYFDSEHRDNTDWHISYFARQEYLEKMAQHIVDY